jgi:hypothetical protein
MIPSGVANSVVGKNTLRTSKLGSDLHADFDRIETTFLPTTQDLNPFFTVNAWKRTTNLITDVRCRSFVALRLLSCVAPSRDDLHSRQTTTMHACYFYTQGLEIKHKLIKP